MADAQRNRKNTFGVAIAAALLVCFLSAHSASANTPYGYNTYGSGTYGGFVTSTAPVVSISSIGTISASTAVLNATITSDGGASSTVRGFTYGTTTGGFGLGTTTQTGTFGSGAFSSTIISLTPSTLYYYRAYAVNSVGTTTSATSSFTTLSDVATSTPPVVTPEENNGSGGRGHSGQSVGMASGGTISVTTSPTGSVTTTTTTTTTNGSTSSYTRSLDLGSTGTDVTVLQSFLISKGYSIPAGATGYFGAQTQIALASFQRASSITPAVGYFGPVTMAYINGLGSGTIVTPTIPVSTTTPVVTATTSVSVTRDLTLGSTGEDVRALQQYLNTHGYEVAAQGPGAPGLETSIFGYATQAALVRLQKAAGITPSVGYYGAVTRAYVMSH